MAVTSKSRAVSRCRKNILPLLLVLSVFVGAFSGMAALAQSAVTNTATVAPPAGVSDPEPGNNSDDAVLSVTTLAQDYDFCPPGVDAIFSIVNGVRISRYDAGAAADALVPELDATISGDLNGLMLDPVRNRLLFISRSGANTLLWAYDAANGGWYQAAPAFASPDFPRGGMAPDGVGYLIAGNSATPEVWQVTADPAPGSFGYSVASIGNLSYDQAPTTNSSGDIAFDAGGIGWLSAGVDLYRVDLAGGSLVAVRQVRPLLNGSPSAINWAGVAFAADGTLYVADNTASSAYYAYDPATGVLTQAASTSAGGSRDLASCAFPVLAEPQLSVVKTLAQVNGVTPAPGAAVQAGDVLTYAITIANTGGTVGTLFEGDVVETLPAGTTYVAAGNDFTCAGSSCPNSGAFNIAAGAQVTLEFVVQVDDPTPPGVDSIANAVTVIGVDCAAPGNDCEETTTLAPAVTVTKSADPASGTSVAAGDTITYTLTATILGGALTEALQLTDTLGAGLGFGEVTDAGDFACVGELQCSLPAGTTQGTYAVVYTATVNANAIGTIGNSVAITGGGGDPDPECVGCSTTHELEPPVISTVKSADPADGSQVQPGQVLTYTLTTTVATSATSAPFVLVDTLGAGLSFGEITSAGAFGCVGELVCTLPAATAPGTYAVSYTAIVDADATGTVGNGVVITGDGGDPDPQCTSCSTDHEITPSTIVTVKTADPGDGGDVRPGDTITYTLTTSIATSATTDEFRLTDTLGAGLTFGAVLDAGAFACAGTLECTLPAGTLPGTYAITYTATVDTDATGTVGNSVAITGDGGDPDPQCSSCSTSHGIEPPSIATVKTADPADGSEVRPGDTIAYTLTTTVATSATTAPFVLVDTLGAGLSFGELTDAGAFACTGALECTLPAGTLPGIYAIAYTATVDADATGTVGNSVAVTGDGGDPQPECTTCSTEHSIELPVISGSKTADPADGSTVLPGDTITYTLTATVQVSATTEPLRMTDALGAGLSFVEVTDAGAFACSGALECVLPAGTLPGTYAVVYTATVDADATGTVANSVEMAGGGDPEVECGACSTDHEIEPPAIATVKTADPGPGSEVRPGDTIAYTLTTTVGTSATTAPYVLTDTLGEGLTLVEVTDAGAYACSDVLVCTLPAGTLPGTYAVTYTATVDADATGAVANSVVGVGGGDPEPECATCSTEHEVALPAISTVKSADPVNGAEVNAGDLLTYRLTTTVAVSATTAPYVLTDTLGGGLTLLADSVLAPEGGSCESGPDGLVCTLAAGTLPGIHVFTYQARVDADAVGTVGNSVTGAGGGDPDPECSACSTEHPLAEPLVTVAKTSDPGDGAEVAVGETIVYTLTVTIENAAVTTPVALHDTPGAGLALGELPAGCSGDGATIVCTLAAGTVPGVYTFSYPATVDASATGEVVNAVVAEYGGAVEPVCAPCGTSHRVLDDTELRIVKTAGVRTARIGDLVRYTLTVENIGAVNLVGGTVVDTPPQGFSYVEGSMTVQDGDGAFVLAPARHPLSIGGLDIAAGEQATIVYLLRVGAGVRHGSQVNSAIARSAAGDPISNVATAQVTIEGDPLLDDSLVFGTVFDDRDGDGWQDSAALSGLRAQGGFAPAAYVAGSTTIDRGAGAQPLVDASAPLLRGIDLGDIAGRQSEADPAAARQVVIRQRLTEARFTDDFVLSNDQGMTVRMDAAGRTTVERSGEAARGLTAAEPTVERRLAQVDGGIAVEYVIGNAGIDERGIPGVRIASVDGLLVETDQYGRYHLLDVQGGARGYRNFILKVDPSTLPPGSAFTTDNPLLRRITPGVPVRFDFGVRLPVEAIRGGSGTIELGLGEVIFAPGSAEVRPEYGPAIAAMAAQVNAHGGGAVVITADGDSQALAFDRAGAVRDLLRAQVAPEYRDALTVEVRTEVHDALVGGVNQDGALLGTVLFDTDRAAIRPEYLPLLERVAARLEQLGGGAVLLVGHTDVRGSHAYNTALGLRRARAVYEALAERLNPELRATLRVESSNDPTAPVGPERK